MPPVITLLTDFGLGDGYVAELKAVLLAALPETHLVDVSHEVTPGDIGEAQYLLARCWRRFSPGTTHLVVVDPGVGTARRALAARAAGHGFVGPDNGVLSPVLEGATVVELPVPDDAAPTFHGRDVFAPAAARLAGGVPVERLGRPALDAVRAPLPAPRREGAEVVGAVLHVDRFGTLITNIPGDWVPAGTVRAGGRAVGPVRRTFGDVARGAVVAVIGSGGTVEVAVRDGSAAAVLGVGVGAEVRVS